MPVSKKTIKKEETIKTPITEEESIKIPQDYIKMPAENLSTKGIYYDFDIYCRSLKGSEIMRLADIDETNADEIIDNILSDVILLSKPNKTYKKDIYLNDKLNLLFFVRVLTYKDPNFKINYTCSNESCKAENKLHFTMDNVEINYIDSTISDKDLKYKTEDGVLINFNLITIEEESNIRTLISELEKSCKRNNLYYDSDLALLSAMVKINSEGFENEFLKYKYFIDKISAVDLVKLKSKINKLECGITTEIKSNCSECGGQDLVPVMFFGEFFIPEYIA